MSLIEHVLDAAPPGGHRELWVAARQVVRHAVCRLVLGGVDPREILVVIPDHGTVTSDVIHVVFPEAILQQEEPLVAVLLGEQRHVVAAVLRGVETYTATVPAGSFAVVTVPVGVAPMISMSRVVGRRNMS